MSQKSFAAELAAHRISMEEIEQKNLVKMPTEQDAGLLNVNQFKSGIRLGDRFKVVEACENNVEVHKLLNLPTQPIGALSVRPRRADIMLVLDTTTKFLWAMVPRYQKNGEHIEKWYWPVSKAMMKFAYGATVAQVSRAIEQNNIEVVDGVRRFMFPSAVLIRGAGATEQRAKKDGAGPATLATSAASASDLLFTDANMHDADLEAAIEFVDTMSANTVASRQKIAENFTAENEKNVNGFIRGHVSIIDDIDSTMYPPNQAGTVTFTAQTNGYSQLLDLSNHAIAGTVLQLKSDVNKDRRSGKKPGSGNSSIVKSPPPASVSDMSSKSEAPSTPKRKAVESSVSTPKRSLANGSQSRVADDLTARLSVLSTGIFDHSMPNKVTNNAAKGDPVPVFFLSGDWLAPICADPARIVKPMAYLEKLNKEGIEGMSEGERDYITQTTLADLMFKKLGSFDDAAPHDKIAMMRVIPVLAFQFMAGMMQSKLGEDIEQIVPMLVRDVIQPLVDKHDEKAGELEQLRGEVAALKKKLEDVDKAAKAQEEAEAKAKKEKEEAEAKAKKEKEEAEAKAKKEKEEAAAKAKKEPVVLEEW